MNGQALTFQVALDELAAASARLSFDLRQVLPFLAVAALGLYYSLQDPDPSLFVPLGIVCALFIYRVTPGGRTRMWAKAIERQAPNLLEQTTVSAEVAGISFGSPSAEWWLAWKLIEKVVDRSDGVGLIARNRRIMWIPARAFGDREQQSAWCDQAQAWMSQGSKPGAAWSPPPPSGGG